LWPIIVLLATGMNPPTVGWVVTYQSIRLDIQVRPPRNSKSRWKTMNFLKVIRKSLSRNSIWRSADRVDAIRCLPCMRSPVHS